jgi:O-antigen chain-terminating methyltransferase
MSDDFYRAFEERYYAPRDAIKQLRRQYLPFVAPLAQAYPGAGSFDIGCGRGEWLELMQEAGLKPCGVDLNEGMLQACVELGLPAQQGDGVARLKALEDESQAIVSAFHVVEHISFEQLRTVIAESLRVLKPGGLLFLETPNPENIGVGTRNFYLDPTHQRPIPDVLLSFMVEYAGYSRVKVMKLQEDGALAASASISLLNVLTGVSPDYAVVGQKAGPDALLQALAAPFEKEYGLGLPALAWAYDVQKDKRSKEAVAQAEQALKETAQALQAADHTLHEMEAALARAQAESHDLNEALARATADSHALNKALARAAADSRGLHAQLEAMRNSSSWKITAPLRKLGAILRRRP